MSLFDNPKLGQHKSKSVIPSFKQSAEKMQKCTGELKRLKQKLNGKIPNQPLNYLDELIEEEEEE